MKLSIIIPYYNTKQYTDELLDKLAPQITDDVEVILIDDCSPEPYKTEHKWLTIYRNKTNKGPAKTRNIGLTKAAGDYIQFIDSDDMVADNFVDRILDATTEGKDLIEYSWKSLNTNTFNFKLNGPNDRLNCPSVVTRTFKRSYIGSTRFNEKKDATEDEDFSRRLGYLYKPVDVTVITDYLYFYRTETPDSNVKTYKQGIKHTKRITYYYDHVTADRLDIYDAIKADDEENEVILLTRQCDIPELRRYCQILTPCRIWTHYLKGDPYNNIEFIPVPIESQVILYINQLNVIGGIESFIYHFMATMSDKYEIALLIANIPIQQWIRFEKYCAVLDYSPKRTYICDTLIMLRILDTIPGNIQYKQSVQMCHACRTNPRWQIPQNTDYIVNVSQASKDSFYPDAANGIVIHNPITKSDRRALLLVSATRIPAPDKGKNEERMRRLAEMLIEADIPFLWYNFSEGIIPNPPKGLVNVGVFMDIQPYIARADYLVQLSDSEAWSYSILEALVLNVPVLVCPFPSTAEMGIKDGENGYILPYDMDFDVTQLLKVPQFTYTYDNEPIIAQWQKILGKAKPKKRKKTASGLYRVIVLSKYHDLELNRTLDVGEIVEMTKERISAILSVNKSLIKVLEG